VLELELEGEVSELELEGEVLELEVLESVEALDEYNHAAIPPPPAVITEHRQQHSIITNMRPMTIAFIKKTHENYTEPPHLRVTVMG
jgi:hypothetical protein